MEMYGSLLLVRLWSIELQFKQDLAAHVQRIAKLMTSCSNMSYSLLHDDALMNVASILTLNQGCGAASHIGAFRKQHVNIPTLPAPVDKVWLGNHGIFCRL